MRLILKECRKMADWRIALILAVFTVFYYMIFLQIWIYPTGGQETSSPYDVPYAARLVDELGPTLAVGEWNRLDAEKERLTEELEKLLADDPVLAKNGISTCEQMQKRREELGDKDELAEAEQELYDAFNSLWFLNKDSSILLFELQFINGMEDKRDYGLMPGATVREVREELTERAMDYEVSDLYLDAMETRFARTYLSVMPQGVMYVLRRDMAAMAVLLVICCMAVVIPWQVREHIRGVIPLYATTKTGRRIFQKQYLAATLVCGAVCALQLGIYLLVFTAKGLSVFWKCPSWSMEEVNFWLQSSFGVYTAAYVLMVWLFAMAAAGIVYLLGKWASNYITGIAAAIPLGIASGFAAYRIFDKLFYIKTDARLPYWEVLALAVWISVAALMLVLSFQKDKRRGL